MSVWDMIHVTMRDIAIDTQVNPIPLLPRHNSPYLDYVMWPSLYPQGTPQLGQRFGEKGVGWKKGWGGRLVLHSAPLDPN